MLLKKEFHLRLGYLVFECKGMWCISLCNDSKPVLCFYSDADSDAVVIFNVKLHMPHCDIDSSCIAAFDCLLLLVFQCVK